jgi:hypothetical protein
MPTFREPVAGPKLVHFEPVSTSPVLSAITLERILSFSASVNQYPWINAIAKSPTKDRRFYDPKKEGQIWAVQLVWKAVFKGGKWTKVPFNPKNGKPASSTDPATWSVIDSVCHTLGGGGYDGIGFKMACDARSMMTG